ncbi:MAG: hypothetical protein WBQ60_08170 [Asticcacaulis sp.]
MKPLYLALAVLMSVGAGPVMAQDGYYDGHFESLKNLYDGAMDNINQSIKAARADDFDTSCKQLKMAGGKLTVGRIDAENDLEEMNSNGTSAEKGAIRSILKLFKEAQAAVTTRLEACPNT